MAAIALIGFDDAAVVVTPRQFLSPLPIVGRAGVKLLLITQRGVVFLGRLAHQGRVWRPGVFDLRAVRLSHPVMAIPQRFSVFRVPGMLLREGLKGGYRRLVLRHRLR